MSGKIMTDALVKPFSSLHSLEYLAVVSERAPKGATLKPTEL